MKGQVLTVILICIILLLADAYIISGIRGAFGKRKFVQKKGSTITYWAVSVLVITGMLLSVYAKIPVGLRAGTLLLFFLLLILKFTFIPFALDDDLRRLIVWIKHRNKKPATDVPKLQVNAIPRSEFLMKAGLIAGAVPLTALGFGVALGAYDYRVRY